LAAAAVLLAVLAMWPSGPPPRILGSTQLTRDGRSKECTFTLGRMRPGPRLVSDGLQVYFSEIVDNEVTVAQVSTKAGHTVLLPRSLPGTFADGVLDFTPLRHSLLLIGLEEHLWEMSLPSGARHRLGEVLADDAKWSPDARRLAYANGRSVFLANADGSAPRKLAELEGEAYLLAWSPDGGRLRFSL
jgi:hypothetical protein